MKTQFLAPAFAALTFSALASSALASGGHEGGHSPHGEHGGAGEPGLPDKVTRTVRIVMKETESGRMLFEPATLTVRPGQTVRFAIRNAGALDHEFVLDDPEKLLAHKAEMEQMPAMDHDDPNAIRLGPGETGDIVWRFLDGGTFEFACLVPGHYEAGMRGTVTVTDK